MRAVWLAVPEHFLEERRRLGHDRADELWDGVLHMVPPPSSSHSSTTAGLSAALVAIGRRRGLQYFADPIGLFEHDTNYRCADFALARPEHVRKRGLDSAELIVEILSPHDESRDKFEFYAKLGVREIWLIDPISRDIEVWELVDGAYVERAPTMSPILGIQIVTTAEPSLELIDGDQAYVV